MGNSLLNSQILLQSIYRTIYYNNFLERPTACSPTWSLNRLPEAQSLLLKTLIIKS